MASDEVVQNERVAGNAAFAKAMSAASSAEKQHTEGLDRRPKLDVKPVLDAGTELVVENL